MRRDMRILICDQVEQIKRGVALQEELLSVIEKHEIPQANLLKIIQNSQIELSVREVEELGLQQAIAKHIRKMIESRKLFIETAERKVCMRKVKK